MFATGIVAPAQAGVQGDYLCACPRFMPEPASGESGEGALDTGRNDLDIEGNSARFFAQIFLKPLLARLASSTCGANGNGDRQKWTW
jgi:hypothetical protein